MINVNSINLNSYCVQNNKAYSRNSFNFKTKIVRMEIKNAYQAISRVKREITYLCRVLNRFVSHSQYVRINRDFETIYNKHYEYKRKVFNKKLANLQNKIKQEYLSSFEGCEAFVENLTNLELPDNVKRGLMLGPKYAFNNNLEETVLSVIVNVEKCVNNIKDMKDRQICRGKIKNTIVNFMNKNKDENNYNKVRDNLVKSDINSVFRFKRQHSDELVFLHSDKGNSVVVFPKSTYIEKINEQLSGEVFEKLKKNPVATMERNINKLVKEMYEGDMITKETMAKVLSNNTTYGQFYGTVKTHKEGYPIRGIVTSYDTPNSNLSKFLADILKHLVTFEHRIKNSMECLDRLKKIKMDDDEIMISADVINLFNCVPVDVVRNIIKNKWRHLANYTSLSEDIFFRSLDICLSSNIFRFQKDLFKQKRGVPIGGSLSPILADLVMDDIYKTILAQIKPKEIMIYVDDSFIIVKKVMVQPLLSKLNEYHNDLKFTSETESDNKINFLDISINRGEDGFLTTNLYTKPQKSFRTINYQSQHPQGQKINILKNEIKRSDRLSHPKYRKENTENIVTKFARNGYPKQLISYVINQCQRDRVRGNVGDENGQKKGYNYDRRLDQNFYISGSIPYVPGLSEGIKNLLKKNNINIAYSLQKPLVNIFNNKSVCDKFETKNIIYAVPCKTCWEKENKRRIYVGETKRFLKTRLREHGLSVSKVEPTTALNFHAITDKHVFSFEDAVILRRERDQQKRKFTESVFINVYSDEAVNFKTQSETTANTYADIISKIKGKFYKPEKLFFVCDD